MNQLPPYNSNSTDLIDEPLRDHIVVVGRKRLHSPEAEAVRYADGWQAVGKTSCSIPLGVTRKKEKKT